MSNLRMKLQMMFFALVLGIATTAAQSNIRYVKVGGAGSMNGSSWDNAYANIQEAIDALTSGGEVWVAEGTYYPTGNVGSGTATYDKSFIIPGGITVRGGFAGTETALNQRTVKSDKNFGKVTTGPLGDGVDEARKGVYEHKTILCGDPNASQTSKMVWNDTKQQFDVTFYGNSYHVVWFATNGFTAGRANGLTQAAMLEGCIVEGGHAYSYSSDAHPHEAYGGGIYMVANSTVKNCEVRKCDATRSGGGIYMDGGGVVRRTYVHNCQALGIGTEYGMGGGIFEDGNTNNSKERPIVVAQSVVTNCVGRLGGGMALNGENATGNGGKNKYSIVANSTIVNNNTASIEAGGVYTYKGCGLASMTIVNNKCNGSGIVQNGVTTGRSGGVYSRDAAYIGNTVIWGNECAANDDIQYASSRSSLSNTEKTHFYYNALSNSGIADWSLAEKMGVLSLEKTNNNETGKAGSKGFPLFFKPTPSAGYYEDIDEIFDTSDEKQKEYNWQVSSESFLSYAGIATIDLDHEGLTPAPEKNIDMQFGIFNSRPTIGALISQVSDIAPATNVIYDGVTYDDAYFVDPSFIYAEDNPGSDGNSWDTPARFLGNVLDHIGTTTRKVVVFVKEGTVNNTRANDDGSARIRTTSLDIPSNVTLVGSFDKELTGTDITKRNPVLNPTIISAKLLNDYKYNIAHLISIDNKQNITIDGFKLTFANANSDELNNTNKNGAAITINGSTSGISFKNLIVSNCYGEKGTVVYANASTASFENCIFHNNTTELIDNSGLIYGINGSNLSFDHCNVLRSVGHVSYLDATTKNNWKNSMFYGNLRQKADNTNECNTLAIAAFDGAGVNSTNIVTNLTGERCMFDLVSRPLYDNRDPQYVTKGLGVNLGANIPGNSTYYVRTTGKGATTTETNPHGLEYAYTSGWANGYPRMVNPTKNAGYSVDGDVTYYGRATSFEPHNDNPVINAASTNGVAHTSPLPSNVWGNDITTLTTRDFGGLPDIGAVESKFVPAGTDDENANPDGQPEYGRAMYVRDYRLANNDVDYTAGGSGMSWQEAINGNAYYTADGVNHGSDKDAKIDKTEEYEETTYTQGAPANITDAATRNTGILLKNANNRYLAYSSTSGLYLTTDVAQATLFKIATSDKGYTITAIYEGNDVAIGYTGTGNNGKLAYGTNATYKTWYRVRNTNTSSNFANKASGTGIRYITSTTGNVSLTTTSTVYSYYVRNKTTETKTRTVTVKAVNGLQYAVNSRYKDYSDQGKSGNKGVYVGAGTYTNATPKDAESVEQPYAYMMKEGVDVYGGFPSIGNPGMDQREPKKFETILQAQTGNPFVTLGEHKVYSGSGQDGKYAFVPTNWGANAGSTDGNEQASVGRVLVQPTDFNVKTTWDGFTLQHGYLHTARMHNIGSAIQNLNTTNLMTAGGAGALIQNNGVLTNCNVKENLLLCYPNGSQMTKTGDDQNKTVDTYYYTYLLGGAGVFMTGNDAVVENSQIFDNQILTKQHMRHKDSEGWIPDNLWMLGAGLYQDNGQVYNTIIHDNTAATIKGSANNNSRAGNTVNNEMVLGAGAFIASGYFYNNTIVNNQSATIYHCHKNHCTFAGVHVKNGATIYNSIIADNTSHFGYEAYYLDDPTSPNLPGNGVPVSAFKDDASTRDSRDQTKVHVSYSYIDVNRVATDKTVDTNGRDLVSWNDTEHTNIYLNRAQFAASNTADDTYTSDKIYYKNGAAGTTAENIYHLKMATAESAASPAINAGRSPIPNVIIPDYDASYDDRIQDCKIDMGAYESDGRANIHPQVNGNQLVFYVTPEGYGRTDGSDPANAACAPKLQMVIDAAGRYKVQNPEKQVIVKVANSYSLHQDGESADFTYYATRTTDQGSTDTRLWSIQVPRGVEVWGGYTDVASDHTMDSWTNDNNGFQARDITKNPTYFDSYFYNKDMKINATTYHVVTFTERIYDKEGKPYLKTDFTSGTPLPEHSSYDGNQREESDFLHMKDRVSGNVITVDDKVVSNRAVIDGIFVTGGNADGKALSGTTNLNANGYGGAAIVTDYAYVRNCIVTNNKATNGGGLALTDHALVSGSLIIENNADNMGGGLYVFEDGAVLSNGIIVNTKAINTDPAMDTRMSHVITSTIVGNIAEQGGGVWFTNDTEANARFNSVAIWQNEATDQSNVFGMVNPEQPTEDETIAEIFYPFAYSLIQNIRASGTNNLNAENLNSQGVRFVDEGSDVGQATVDQFDMAKENEDSDRLIDKLDDFGFYGLTKYSILCSNGMPVNYYERMMNDIAISDVDILKTPRITPGNGFVEIGARALALEMPKQQLMLRLFVAEPKYVDTETADRFMRLKGTSGAEQYYSQMGSSFAYPFNSLQDALDYIKMARNGEIISNNTDAQNLPFEIIVGKGTYYPKKDLNGKTESVWAATYAIPEGVTIIGGFNPVGGVSTGNTTYYGRYYQKGTGYNTDAGSIDKNVDPIPTSVQRAAKGEIGRGYNSGNETVHLPATADGKPAMDITFQQWHIQDIADRRAMNDNNKNGIIEPWEFANQTIISGNAVNGETDGVYHIMTAVADEDAVGSMPKVQEINEEFVGSTVSEETGYQWKEKGQQIRLNGLIVTGGNALTYLSTALDEYGKYIFYQGAGLQVDGNRYKNKSGSTAVFHNSAAYGVGYRDIPVSITNCQFRNNIAGYGGAISTNGSLSIFGSSFEQNIAVAQTETAEAGDDWKDINGDAIAEVNYPGQGGAILATRQLSAFNTLFANNEARYNDRNYPATVPTSASDLFSHKSFRVPSGAAGTLRAAGGAIMMGSAAEHHIVNCDFVRNKANAYPAVFTMNPTFDQTKPGIDTHDYSQIINTVAWGNEVNVNAVSTDDPNYLRASKLMVNIGKKDRTTPYIKIKGAGGFYDPSFAAANVPSATDLASTNAENTDWQEAVWFCAYEEGVGFEPTNTNDLRDKIVYSPTAYAPTMIKTANSGIYQNCNIKIVADNGDNDGPNFGNPSMKAGYDGYMESADWSPSRLNHLTDNGNGWISQTVDNVTLDVTFHNDEDGEGKYQGAYSVTHYIEKVIGAQQFPEYKLWLAIGNEKYMESTTETEAENVYINNTNIGRPQKNLPRISPDPSLGVTKAYIDIGVYEYMKSPLLKPGSEVDILWVIDKVRSGETKGDGHTWKNPTDNLQEAIETLLKSRNGHKKEIRLMNGTYSPVTSQTVEGVSGTISAFVIDTKKMNDGATAPTGTGAFEDGKNNNEYYAQAITIKGGYSKDHEFNYDPNEYPTVIRQSSTTSANKDYLIYVNDPTLRYMGSTGTANDNATFGTTGESSVIKTMPIQIDGVTLINDQAAASIKGSAIYYPDYADGVAGAHSVSVGGEVVYYESKEEMEKIDPETGKHIGKTVDHVTDFPLILDNTSETLSDPAKLLITKTQVIGSGNKTSDNPTAASAVYIGKNGGPAMIYNSVFHSNYGMPLDAWNTINVNNTFGKNAGIIRLQNSVAVSVESQMHNSVMWENNGGNAQFSIPGVTVTDGNTGATCANFTYNSFTGGNILYTGDSDMATNNYNTGLIANNSDLMNGPNFVDPDNANIEERNFDIRPSVRLLNKGMDTSLEAIGSPDVNDGKYYTLVVNNKYDFSLASTTDQDFLGRERLKTPRIDIGAYEFQGSLRSILYVDPNKNHNNNATGENWDDDKVYGNTDLQNAVDLAALAHMTDPTEESYVFVKGNASSNPDRNTNETLIVRDGVTVFGSINTDDNNWHDMKEADGETPKYNNVKEYIEDMKNTREGVASNRANKTIVTGIKTSEYTEFDGMNNDTPAVVDGFVVTATSTQSTPVIDITNKSENAVIALSNIIAAGNTMADGVDVAQVSNGLLYEALIRDNVTTGAALRVSNTEKTKGYAVNVTVEGKTVGADNSEPVDGNAGAEGEKKAQIYKSITNSINGTSGSNAAGGNAPYKAVKNKGISGYYYNIADPNLNYQLTETSKYIDMCDAVNPMVGIAPNLVQFINYPTDRDILGNPRWLKNVSTETAGTIDRGAFETWRVDKNFVCGTHGTNSGNAIAAHFYPHDGSVVYVMENKSLVIDALDEYEVNATAENPGFLLVKKGANFYGSGRPVNCAYVAVERDVRKGGSIVALPYEMNYGVAASVAKVDVDANNDLSLDQRVGRANKYSGNERMEWNYIFQTGNTKCWDQIDIAAANQGVLFEPFGGWYVASDEDNAETLLRFTSKGNALNNYIYQEAGVSKDVTLTKYDDVESTNNGADYTDEKDMGWNCFGIPYLVSNYNPAQTISVINDARNWVAYDEDGDFAMHNPHTLWLYYDGKVDAEGNQLTPDGEQNVNGDGGYYSVPSWKSTAADWNLTTGTGALWVGEGIFTQTATLGSEESLTFYVPVAPLGFASPAKAATKRYYAGTVDGIEETEMTNVELIATEYYTTDGVRVEKPRRGVVTIVKSIYSNGTAKVAKQFVK